MLGGVLGGFVAISAACDVVVPLEAIIIGSLAGLLYPLTSAFLKRTVLKKNYQAKAAGVIATHGFCGVWGTLCVALFGSEGLLSVPDTEQLIAQLTGISVAFGFSIVSAYLCLLVYRTFSGLTGNK
jgi:Amt family ammonium transporter